MANNSLALNLTIRARESEKRGILIVRFLLWEGGGGKNDYILDKSRGVSWEK